MGGICLWGRCMEVGRRRRGFDDGGLDGGWDVGGMRVAVRPLEELCRLWW